MTGRVVWPNGDPASGTSASVSGKAGASATSDTGGAFTIADIPVETGESLTVSAVLEVGGVASVAVLEGITPAFGGVVNVGDLVLQPLCAYHFTDRFDPPGNRIPGYPYESSSSEVRSLAIFDDGTGPALYAGGLWWGGAEPGFVARWTGSGWDLFATFDQSVNALTVFDDGTGPALYAGGSFSVAGGVAATGIARWAGAAWSPVGAGLGGASCARAETLEVLDDGTGDALYAGGCFETAGGAAADGVARWKNGSWTAVGDGLSEVYALEVFDDGSGRALFAGGGFQSNSSGSVPLSYVAKLENGQWRPLGEGVGNQVYALGTFDFGSGPSLMVGGTFTTAGGLSVYGVATWSGAGWGSVGSLGAVRDFAVLDDGLGPVLYAGVSNELQRWNGTAWEKLSALGYSTSRPVLDLMATVSSPLTGRPALLLGGEFSTAQTNGSFDLEGNKVAEWAPECDVLPPTIDDLDPPDPVATGQVGASLAGTVTDGDWLWLDDQPVALQPDGSFNVGPIALSPGLQQFELTAYDQAGNVSRLPYQVLQDSMAPTIQIVAPADGAAVVTTRPVFELSYGDDQAVDTETVSVIVGGATVAVDCLAGEASATCTPVDPLPIGTTTVLAKVRDLAGNEGVSTGATLTVSPEETTVIGTVQLPGGAGVAGAQVSVLGDGGRSVATGVDGSFAMANVLTTQPFTVVALFRDPTGSLTGIVRDVTGVAGGTTDVGVIQLHPSCEMEWDPDFGVGVGVAGTLYPSSDSARVLALEVFDDGSGPALYVGGEFQSAGGTTAHGLAKWDGSTWSQVGEGVHSAPGTNWGAGVVYALRTFDDGSGPALYVGGDFLCVAVGGVDCASGTQGLARWDGSEWSVVGGSFGASGGVVDPGVLALEVVDFGQGPALVAGGRFTSVGGVPVRNVAYWDGQAWSAFGPGLGGGQFDAVYALAAYDAVKGQGQTIYAAGDFTETGGPEFRLLRGVAAWDGNSWEQLGNGIVGPESVWTNNAADIRAMAVFQDRLFIAGSVVDAGGLVVDGMASWDGRAWSAVGSGFVGVGVDALQVFDDGTGSALYALGATLNGQNSVVARWDGVSWSVAAEFGRNEGLTGVGGALEIFDDDPGDGIPERLVVGTPWTSVLQPDGAELVVGGIASLEGSSWTRMGPVAPFGTVLAMASNSRGGDPAELFLSGKIRNEAIFDGAAFTLRWDGQSFTSLPDFWTWESDASGPYREPRAAETMKVLDTGQGPELYATGNFDGAGPWDADGLVRWTGSTWAPISTDSFPDGPFDGSTGYFIRDLEVFDFGNGPELVAAGEQSIARWSGSSWVELGAVDRVGISCFADDLEALTVLDDGSGAGPELFAAGCFNRLDGMPIDYIARWDGSSWSSAGVFDDVVEDLVTFDDGTGPAVYAAGRFTTVDGVVVNHVARWDGTSWGPVGNGFSPTGSLNGLAVVDSGEGPELWYQGYFRLVSTTPTQYGAGVARWDGTRWVTIDSGRTYPGLPIAGAPDGFGPGLFTSVNSTKPLARFYRPAECGVGTDTSPPTLSFTSPGAGETIPSFRPDLVLTYDDQGSGVDPGTLAVQANGASLPVTCSYQVQEATCTPDADLPIGTVALTATVSDVAGNSSAPAQVTVTVVAGTPTLSISSPVDGGLVLSDLPAVGLSYTENADPATLDLQASPVAVGFSCTTGAASATCTPTFSLPEGANILTATVQGFDGSSAVPAQVSFTVDLAPPTLAFITPADGATTNQQQPELWLSYADIGAGVDPASLAIQDSGVGLAVTCSSGPSQATCTPDTPMGEGAHTLTATIDDLAGRTSVQAQLSFEILLDFTGPVISLTSPVADSAVAATEVRFTGTLDEPGTLILDGAPVALDGTNAFDHGPVPLAEGWNAFELVATDRVGNVTTQTVRVLRDTADRFSPSWLRPTAPTSTPRPHRSSCGGATAAPASTRRRSRSRPTVRRSRSPARPVEPGSSAPRRPRRPVRS